MTEQKTIGMLFVKLYILNAMFPAASLQHCIYETYQHRIFKAEGMKGFDKSFHSMNISGLLGHFNTPLVVRDLSKPLHLFPPHK